MDDFDVSVDDSSCSETSANPQFADKLYKEVPKDKNVLISPINVEMVLAMAYQGAAGETADKLAAILGVADQKEAVDKYKCITEKLNGVNNATVSMAHKIYIIKDIPLKSTFETVTEESFMSKIEPIDFTDNKKAADEINHWVENKTNNTIKNLIAPDTLDESASLVLLSALSFKSNWDKPFLPEDTTWQPFYISKDKAVDCEMMFTEGLFKYCSYYSKVDGNILELPCRGKEISMIIILPYTRETLEDIETQLANLELSKLMKDADFKEKEMEIFLPKFKIEVAIDIKPLLKNMGLETMFDPNTVDFSGISEGSQPVNISHFFHKTVIEINEKGEEAVDADESLETKTSAHSASEFIVDSPFMFILQANGEDENTVLLVGKVLNPKC